MLLLQTFSYVGAWNVILDGHNEGGGAFFPLIYFRKVRDRTFSIREDHKDTRVSTILSRILILSSEISQTSSIHIRTKNQVHTNLMGFENVHQSNTQA